MNLSPDSFVWAFFFSSHELGIIGGLVFRRLIGRGDSPGSGGILFFDPVFMNCAVLRLKDALAFGKWRKLIFRGFCWVLST